jgi:WD40 repeat protein
VRIWEKNTWKQLHVLRGHKGRVTALSFSPDGACIASASVDKTVKLWDVTTGQLIKTMSEHGAIVFSVDFSPKGDEFASCGRDGFVLVTEVSSLSERLRLGPHSGAALAVSYSPDGKIIASAGGQERSSAEVCLWDTANGRRIALLHGHSDWPLAVDWCPDGMKLVSESYGEIILWNAKTQEPICRTLKTEWSMVCLALSADGSRLVSGGWMFLNDTDGRPDYQKVIGGIQVWDASTGKLDYEFAAHDKGVTSVDFSGNNLLLVSGSSDGTAKIWNLAPVIAK